METEIKFEPSGRHGITPVGAYLMDVALRFGIRIEDSCGRTGQCDDCAVKIIKGAEFLSQPTQAELEHLSAQRRNNGERLSCQAKIEKAGEICVMTTEKKKPVETTFEAFEKEFSKLPLEEKIQQLLELEKTTLGETLNYILNLPFTVGEKIRDGIAHFGFQMEEEEKKAKRPTEHQEEVKEEKGEEKNEAPKAKKPTTTRTVKPKTEAKKTTTRRKTTKSEGNRQNKLQS